MRKRALSALGTGLLLLCVAPTPVSAEHYASVRKRLTNNGVNHSVIEDPKTGGVQICENTNTTTPGCGGVWTCNNNNDCKCSSGACTPPPTRTAPKAGKATQANKDVTTRGARESCIGPCRMRSPLLQQNILESGGGFGTNKPGAGGSPGAGARGGSSPSSGPSLR
jgi:hypothetical protein